jgi:hypothetical protein
MPMLRRKGHNPNTSLTGAFSLSPAPDIPTHSLWAAKFTFNWQQRVINSLKRYLHVGSGAHSIAVGTGAKWHSHSVPIGFPSRSKHREVGHRPPVWGVISFATLQRARSHWGEAKW